MSNSAASSPGDSGGSWNPGDYVRVGGFVAELGHAALDLLDPKPGERIVDIGCGEGALTEKIAGLGAVVVGIDNSPEMVAAAQARGLDARLGDAARMDFDTEFDAAFSNAALHWMPDKRGLAAAIYRALKPGGRFAGEMGGRGNLERLREALDTELIIRGHAPPPQSTWYSSAEDFADVYEDSGFDEIDARLIDRPTRIEHGIAAWVTTFRKGWLDRAGVPDAERAELGAAIAERFGSDVADYVRLRFIMKRPL